MTPEQTVKILQDLEIVVTKTRSILKESMGVEDENDPTDAGMMVLKDLNPWLFDEEKSVLIPLSRLNDRLRKGQPCQMSDLLSMAHIVEVTPAIQMGFATRGYEFPTPQQVMERWGKLDREYMTPDEIDAAGAAAWFEYDINHEDTLTDGEIVDSDHPEESAQKERRFTQHGYSSIYDFPHNDIPIKMMQYTGVAPLSFKMNGTTIYQGDTEIVSAVPWIDGSMEIHVQGSKNSYLVSVVDVLEAVMKLEGIDIDIHTLQGKMDTGERFESTELRHFKSEPVKTFDIYGSEIEVGAKVSAMIGMTDAMVYGDDADDTMLIRRGWRGIVTEVVSQFVIEVDFERMDGESVQILAEYVGVLGEDDV